METHDEKDLAARWFIRMRLSHIQSTLETRSVLKTAQALVQLLSQLEPYVDRPLLPPPQQ